METKKMSAVVLAGGESSRMGKNKLLLPLGKSTIVGALVTTLAGLFAEVVVVTDQPASYRDLPVRITGDIIICTKKNSLTGIHAGLSAATAEYSLVVAGDMPFVKPGLLYSLCALSDGYDVTIPRQGPYFQPLCAVYHKNCLPHIEALLTQERFKILDFFPHVRVRCVDTVELLSADPELVSFFNVNTPADYRLAVKMALGNNGRRND